MLLLVLLTVALRAWNLMGFPVAQDDEGTYLAQAWAVRNGLGLSHYTYWYDHPPMGWVQLAALGWLPSRLLPDSPALLHGRIAMLPVAAASAVLIHTVAVRLGASRTAAAGAVLLNAVSPLATGLQRQVFLDNFATLWALAAIALALSPRRHLGHHTAAGAAFALAVLSKETAAVVLPALLAALWRGSDPRTRLFSGAGFTSGALCGLAHPLYAALKKEVIPGEGHVSLYETVVWQLTGRAGSGWMFTDGTAAAGRLEVWLAQDPLLITGGVAAGVAAVGVRRLQPLAAAVLVPALMALRPDGYLPEMYVVQLLPFLALALAAVPDAAVRAAARGTAGRIPRALACLTALALLAATAVALAPEWYGHWRDAQRTAHRTDLHVGYREAYDWLHARPARTNARLRIVTDDVLWLDAVHAGFVPATGVIWHYKLDLDPEIVETMPRGWRDIDYAIVSPGMYFTFQDLPTLRALTEHGELIRTFGEGDAALHLFRVPHPEDKDRREPEPHPNLEATKPPDGAQADTPPDQDTGSEQPPQPPQPSQPEQTKPAP